MSKQTTSQPQLINSALSYLKTRSRTAHEITTHLHRRYPQLTATDISQVITYLQDLRLINDYQFSTQYTASKLAKGFGPLVIKLKLKSLGIDPLTIDQTLRQIDQQSQIDSAVRLIIRKRSLFNKLNNKIRVLKIRRYLYSRGYTADIATVTIDASLNNGVK